MKQLPFVLLTVASVAATAPVLAAEVPGGWYVGASVGAVQTTITRNPSNGLAVDDKSDTAWSLRGGYRFHENWALEAGYANLGKVRYHFPGYPQHAVKFEVFHLSAVGILPLTEHLSGFAKLGVASVRANDEGKKASDTTPHAGLGLSYALTQAMSLRADYDYYGRAELGENGVSAKSRHQTLSIGLDYRF